MVHEQTADRRRAALLAQTADGSQAGGTRLEDEGEQKAKISTKNVKFTKRTYAVR